MANLDNPKRTCSCGQTFVPRKTYYRMCPTCSRRTFNKRAGKRTSHIGKTR